MCEPRSRPSVCRENGTLAVTTAVEGGDEERTLAKQRHP